MNAYYPLNLQESILFSYKKLSKIYETGDILTDVAVRSSGTAEDLPFASFAGQQDTFLNVKNNNDILLHIKKCFASLYNDRAISYRKNINYNNKVRMSVGIQKMVRSDLGSAGVAFSVDTESGFEDIIVINGSYGLGELVVGGQVNQTSF